MPELGIVRHERIEGDRHRWRVHLHGRTHPVEVELPDDERDKLDLSDDEVHALLPTALQRRHDEDPEAVLGPGEHDVAPDAPVRVFQTHFMA